MSRADPPERALQRADTVALVATIALLAAYNITRTLWIPEPWQLRTNLLMAFVLGGVAHWARANATELGLHRDAHAKGAIWGGAALLLVFLAVAGFAIASELRGSSNGALDDARLRVPFPDMLYELLINTPLGTVVLEEFAFRGLLLALFLRHTSTLWAMVWSSLLFGCWHILPTLTSAAANRAMEHVAETPGGLVLVVAGNVLSTAVAGAAFAWLRLRTGSLLAPALAHLATNNISFLVGWIFNRLS